MPYKYKNPQTLIQDIKEAFAEVQKGEMSIADALKQNKNSASKELKDMETAVSHWTDIEEKVLIAGIDSINYLDAQSWKYYLPAYLLWAIENRDSSNAYLIDFIIDPLSEYELKESLQKYEALTMKQGEMVYHFFWLMVGSDWEKLDVNTWEIEQCIFQYWVKFTFPTAEQVLKKIKEAFKDVPKGNKTIHEAEANDDYRTATEEERKRDKSKHWEEVKAEHLMECTCALPYLEGDSWIYYIPAYMTWTLQNLSNDSNLADVAYYTLSSDSEFSMNKHQTLNQQQSEAVYSFLFFMESLWKNPTKIEEAIPAHWHEFKPSKNDH